MDKLRSFRPLFVFVLGVAALAVSFGASADHAWNTYHWSTTGSLVVNLGDNVDPVKWRGHLLTASADWSLSTVLDSPVVAGNTRPKSCRATSGMVEVCSANYGGTGWLGVAQIWLSGGHIVQGIAKLNDYYHDNPPYNTDSWRLLVMCQEVGHTYGLGHQDENFDTKTEPGTCMDYTRDPVGSEHPNDHDYEQLLTIYSHVHANATAGSPMSAAPPAFGMPLNGIEQWGRLVSTTRDGGNSTFVQDYGNGFKVVTHVTWTMEMAQHLAHHMRHGKIDR